MKKLFLISLAVSCLYSCDEVESTSTADLADNMRGILTESLEGIILPVEGGGTLYTCSTAEPVSFSDPKGVLRKALGDSVVYGVPLDGVLEVSVSRDGEGFDLKGVEDVTSAWWDSGCIMVQHLQALGNEPGWEVRIDPPNEFVLKTNYGMETHTFPYVLPEVTPGVWTYQVAIGLGEEADKISIIVEEKPCGDSMSDEAFPFSVSVSHNGDSMTGCGRALENAPNL